MNAREFLQALWQDVPSPDGPFLQIWSLRDRKTGYYASAAGVTVDGEQDVFTGVGLAGKRHGPKHRAKAPEVVAIAGLWLDIDIGARGCATRNDAFALSTAYASPTITVDSGHGLHAWYLFEQPWVFRTRSEQERARIIAQQWVALHQIHAAQHGWHIDSVGDLARVLRLPGTLNAKDPTAPRPVIALGLDPASGPRHTYSALARHLTHMPIVERSAAAPTAVPGDATLFDDKLDALIANSPEFAAVWTHQRAPGDASMSAYDLSLCTLAANALNDAELRHLIVAHRDMHGDANDQAKGRRVRYQDLTIARARSGGRGTELDALARRAA